MRRPSHPTADDLLRINQEWSAALARRDVDALRDLLHDDFRIVGASGRPIAKAAYLRFVKRLSGSFEPGSDVQARVFGDTGIVLGRSQVVASEPDRNVSGTYQYINVFSRTGGRWVPVASSSRRIES